jgi:DNA-binding HxlR family transcriptional regulator
MIVDNQIETIANSQQLIIQKKIKNILGHLDPENPPDICPIRDILAPVTDKWSILIFVFLGLYGVMRFNELKRYIHGISAKILSDRLKTLEQDGYIKRSMFPEVPIRVEYELTNFGLDYLDNLLGIIDWIKITMPEIIKRRHKFNNVFK